MMKSDKIKQQIEKLQAELKTAQAEEKKLSSGSPVAIAELLHSKMCHDNHVDCCGWDYESWESMPSNGTRKDWLKRAEKLLAKAKTEGIVPSQLVAVICWLYE